MRVFNSFAPSNCTSSSAACYRKHEKEKRREYERRVLNEEHGTFCPLVLSTSGGWGPSASVALRDPANPLSKKRGEPYQLTMRYLRLMISFSLFRSAHMCLRGAHSSSNHPIFDDAIPLDMIAGEAKIRD